MLHAVMTVVFMLVLAGIGGGNFGVGGAFFGALLGLLAGNQMRLSDRLLRLESAARIASVAGPVATSAATVETPGTNENAAATTTAETAADIATATAKESAPQPPGEPRAAPQDPPTFPTTLPFASRSNSLKSLIHPQPYSEPLREYFF